MKTLILGGTVFLGRHLVDVARARNHEVTLFNRGKSAPGLFPDVEEIHGDRDGGLDALGDRRWDVVLDMCGYVPRVVGDAARAFADRVEHYTFVSSGSVYPDLATATEDDAVGTLDDVTVEAVDGDTYGPLKALCEQAVEQAMPGRALHVRAGLIVGPNDPSDRFTYWPYRVAAGGDVLAPGRPDALVQIIDVRDIAGWMLQAAERRLVGTFNVTGPREPLTMRALVTTCRDVAESDASFIWVDDAFLVEEKVGPWMEMPLWIPETDLRMRVTRVFDEGLTTRPLADTVRDTLRWQETRPADHSWRAGMRREREAEVLAAWRARS